MIKSICLFLLTRVIKMWDLRKNYTAHRHDPVPLQTYPYPGSCMRMRLGRYCTTLGVKLNWNMQINQNKPSDALHVVLQVILDSFWTLRDPTSYVTAPTTISTCSMSAEWKRLQVIKDSALTVHVVYLCHNRLQFMFNWIQCHYVSLDGAAN